MEPMASDPEVPYEGPRTQHDYMVATYIETQWIANGTDEDDGHWVAHIESFDPRDLTFHHHVFALQPGYQFSAIPEIIREA